MNLVMKNESLHIFLNPNRTTKNIHFKRSLKNNEITEIIYFEKVQPLYLAELRIY